ncbi:hypothetical protein BJ944DRAFT_36323 [Cunninghamella echinulata]|nr:hypothetical protein BJ944DRAFT_36323 [Cunninghamella echinulata]
MQNWISSLCPSYIHGFVFIILLFIIYFSLPSYFIFYLPNPQSSHDFHNRIYNIFIHTTSCIIHSIINIVEWLNVIFSSSLPESEETGFEERFKYFIVTSSVLNDIFTQPSTNVTNIPNFSQQNNILQMDTTTTILKEQQENAIKLNYMYGITTLILATFISFFTLTKIIGAFCFHWHHPSYMSLLIIYLILAGSILYFYQKNRKLQIRKLYGQMIVHLQQILHTTVMNDQLIDQIMNKLINGNSIANGNSLSPPNSNLDYVLSKQTNQIQSMLYQRLLIYFKSMIHLLSQLQPLVHSHNLSTLYDMYNVEPISSTSMDIHLDQQQLQDNNTNNNINQQLDTLIYMIYSYRRECFMHLLSLKIMTSGHDSARGDYESLLKRVETIMLEMKDRMAGLTLNMKRMIDDNIDGDHDYIKALNEKNDENRYQNLLNHLNTLEKQLRNIQTKITLCRQDGNGFLHNNKSSTYSFDRIRTRFNNLEQDISHFQIQWNESKNNVNAMYKYERKLSIESLPSPPTSPPLASSIYNDDNDDDNNNNKHHPHYQDISAPLSQHLNIPNTKLTSRQSWITAAAVASFLESRRVYRLQAQQSKSISISE